MLAPSEPTGTRQLWSAAPAMLPVLLALATETAIVPNAQVGMFWTIQHVRQLALPDRKPTAMGFVLGPSA